MQDICKKFKVLSDQLIHSIAEQSYVPAKSIAEALVKEQLYMFIEISIEENSKLIDYAMLFSAIKYEIDGASVFLKIKILHLFISIVKYYSNSEQILGEIVCMSLQIFFAKENEICLKYIYYQINMCAFMENHFN